MGEALVPVVEEIIGWIVIEGVKWLVGYIVGEDGEREPIRFIDDDGDGVPDNPDDPYLPWDLTTLLPDTSEDPVYDAGQIVLITPDGPVVLYAEDEEENSELVSEAYERWIQQYGVLDKPFKNYSVTEGLLFLIFISVFTLFICKIFKRRKF